MLPSNEQLQRCRRRRRRAAGVVGIAAAAKKDGERAFFPSPRALLPRAWKIAGGWWAVEAGSRSAEVLRGPFGAPWRLPPGRRTDGWVGRSGGGGGGARRPFLLA